MSSGSSKGAGCARSVTWVFIGLLILHIVRRD
jgi:hypothetical protein